MAFGATRLVNVGEPGSQRLDLLSVLLTEALPARIRAGTLGLIYALALSVFGGSTQFVVNRLTAWSGSALAPAWYMTGAMTIGFIGILLIRERWSGAKANAARPIVPPAIQPAHA